MALWLILVGLLALAAVFHYFDYHRARPDIRALRPFYVGTPGYVALSLYGMAFVCLLLIFLRWIGVDILAGWHE